MANELFVIHFRGEPVSPDVWRKYSSNYGSSGFYGWRPSKKVYYKLGTAKGALAHLPGDVQNDCEIVRYVPSEVVADAASIREAKIKRDKERVIREAKHKAAVKKMELDRVQYELIELQKKHAKLLKDT